MALFIIDDLMVFYAPIIDDKIHCKHLYHLLAKFENVSQVIVGLVIGYMIFLATRQLTGVFLGYSSYKYEHSAGYCWNHINHHGYQVI